MKNNFIYVFSTKDRDKLLDKNYTMIKANTTQNIYIFKNQEKLDFSKNDFNYILSNTLTF